MFNFSLWLRHIETFSRLISDALLDPIDYTKPKIRTIIRHS